MPSISAKHAALAREIPFVKRITAPYVECAIHSGLAISKLQELVRLGELESIKIGKRRLVKVQSLLALLDGRTRRPQRGRGAAR